MAESVPIADPEGALHSLPSRIPREHLDPQTGPISPAAAKSGTETTPDVHTGATPERAAMGWIE